MRLKSVPKKPASCRFVRAWYTERDAAERNDLDCILRWPKTVVSAQAAGFECDIPVAKGSEDRKHENL